MSWGAYQVGGNSSRVSYLINGTVPVTQVYPFQYGFIVLKQDGMKVEVSPDVLWFD